MKLEYFQMIDRVVSFDRQGAVLSAESTVPAASPVFEGHFPEHPLMPGVLLIEAMAQASGYLLLGLNGFSKMPFLIGVKEAKLRQFVVPATPIALEAALLHDGSGYAVTKAKISVAGKGVCDAELMFRIMPFPANLGQTMRANAERLGMAVEGSAP